MGSNGVVRVACISSILDPEAFAACNFMSLHSSQKLSALASEHRAHDDLNAAFALEVSGAVEVLGGTSGTI